MRTHGWNHNPTHGRTSRQKYKTILMTYLLKSRSRLKNSRKQIPQKVIILELGMKVIGNYKIFLEIQSAEAVRIGDLLE